MKGLDVVEKIAKMGPREVAAVSYHARRGDPPSVALFVAMGMYQKLFRQGKTHEEIKKVLAPALDEVTIELSYA